MKYKVYTKVMEEFKMVYLVEEHDDEYNYLGYYEHGIPAILNIDVTKYSVEEFINLKIKDLGLRSLLLPSAPKSLKNEGDFKIYKHIELFDYLEFKEWKLYKEIEIKNGELYEQNSYEINGEKCGFEIVYNDSNDDVELRIDYISDIIVNPKNIEHLKFYNDINILLKNKREELFKRLELSIKRETKKESIFNMIIKLLKIKTK